MRRFLILSFGITSYGLFGVVFLYLIAFLGNLQTTPLAESLPFLKDILPHSADYGERADILTAFIINAGLIALFGLQHTPMARRRFKAWWTNIVPPEVERSIYVFASNIMVLALIYFWQPIPIVIWEAEATWSRTLLWSVLFGGFVWMVIASFAIDHFHLLGIKQAWQQFMRKPLSDPQFSNSFLYRLIRHPINLGWLLGFWGGPYMTAGHLLLAVGMTIYVFIATYFEERDLEAIHGEDYARYKKEVPMLLPIPGRRRAQS